MMNRFSDYVNSFVHTAQLNWAVNKSRLKPRSELDFGWSFSAEIPTETTGNYYTNENNSSETSNGDNGSSPPLGATAICRDGTYSDSQHRRGTCSWHGGVAKWLVNLP
jgi:hypothetical protein